MIEVKVYLDQDDYDALSVAAAGEGRSTYIRRILRGEWSRHPPKRRTVTQLKDEALRQFVAQEVRKHVERLADAFPVRETAESGRCGRNPDVQEVLDRR